MENTVEVFKLAKVLHDARCSVIYNGAKRIKRECDRFPANLTRQRQYITPEPWIDIALAQAKAALQWIYNQEGK
jgi:hypothetical protein